MLTQEDTQAHARKQVKTVYIHQLSDRYKFKKLLKQPNLKKMRC